MPNYCEGLLAVKGEKEELLRFKEYAKTQKGEKEIRLLDTEKFVPYPKEFRDKDDECKKFWELREKEEKEALTKTEKRELILMKLQSEEYYAKDGYNSGGYDWCIQNWGTKWGIFDAYLSEEDKGLFYTFETAWSPCLPVVLKMSEMFPKLKFQYKYWEGGEGFRGVFSCEKNKIKTNSCYDYKGDRGG